MFPNAGVTRFKLNEKSFQKLKFNYRSSGHFFIIKVLLISTFIVFIHHDYVFLSLVLSLRRP